MAAALLAIVGIVATSAYELGAFGWHPAREESAAFSTYHLARMALSAALAGILTAALARPWLQSESADIAPLWPAEIRNGVMVTAIAAAATAILVWNPALFHWLAREDNILEWLSALFVLAGAIFFLVAALRQARSPLGGVGATLLRVLIPLGFAGLFFLIAMEEISWGQRILGFETPDRIAERNWQSEFNFHNIHTDIAELVYYTGTGLFLIVLPFAWPALRDWRPLAYFADFIPNRSVAALSAPMVYFSYGHWNLVPIQMLVFFTLFAMLVFAVGAARRGQVGETRLFAAIALLIGIGQALVLAYGPQMLDVPDATEFRELFLSAGLFAFAAYYLFDVAPRTRTAKQV
ncbi:hypothetical protein HFP57_01075 [Parasphingopyxis algicola]|uniref:hypothetical protein n=1 Tax=Parasphingopyxis algicola TaxID=2026624 RepID=UPI0015A44C1D|nr:hypothetical protein [Parasphingopyxis algicola]QLC23761.1 hypothetical protein HFP57_01075 [Parasphingopyxis algicola]